MRQKKSYRHIRWTERKKFFGFIRVLKCVRSWQCDIVCSSNYSLLSFASFHLATNTAWSSTELFNNAKKKRKNMTKYTAIELPLGSSQTEQNKRMQAIKWVDTCYRAYIAVRQLLRKSRMFVINNLLIFRESQKFVKIRTCLLNTACLLYVWHKWLRIRFISESDAWSWRDGAAKLSLHKQMNAMNESVL